MFVFVWFFIPETKGRSLESMDELFGGATEEMQQSKDLESKLGPSHVEVTAKSHAGQPA